MDRITAETEQIITDQLNTDRAVGPQGADKARGSRRRVGARLGAGAAAFALTSSFGVAGAHASTPEAAGSGLSQDEYLEVVEQLAERLGDVEGFEDLEDAMGAIDDLEEDAQAAVSYEAAAGDEEVSAILVSTPEEHDFFDGYYQDVVDECRTLDLGDGEIEFQLTDSADGVQVRMESSGHEEWFYMAGQSFGANHVMVVGEAPGELDDYEDVLADQVELMEEEVS